jgi:hypothetical protein
MRHPHVSLTFLKLSFEIRLETKPNQGVGDGGEYPHPCQVMTQNSPTYHNFKISTPATRGPKLPT